MNETLRDQCVKFVDDQVQNIIDMFNKQISQAEICQRIGACPSQFAEESKYQGNDLLIAKSEIVKQANLTCVLCQFAVKILEQYVDENTTEVIKN